MNIFTRNMDVFYGGILEPLDLMLGMTSHALVVILILLAYGDWRIVLPSLFFVFSRMLSLARPYLHAEIQMDKIRSILWTPIHSYFYESMRGKGVIRAFGQESTIMARQNALFDSTTLSFTAHFSCYKWFHLRILYTSMLIPVLTIVTCAMAKGTVSNTMLVIAPIYSFEMTWFWRLFDNYNEF